MDRKVEAFVFFLSSHIVLFESRFSQTMRLLNVRGARDPFHRHKQSCVSFCFNLINAADPNPQVHMPVSQI